MSCNKCQGMFSTHSSVAQLKPETVFHSVNEAEEQYWGQGVLPTFSGGLDTPASAPPSLGSMLLSQSLSIKKIHNYFSQLELRKCCLHLACRRSTFNSLRVVPSCKTRDDGSAKKKQLISDFAYLEARDMRTFKHAYLCAVYPVLAAPDPPASPVSPSQMVPEQAVSNTYSSTTAAKIAANVFTDSQRSLSPYSLHDSGMEESEEAGLIPMESLCEQLRRSFVLTHCVFQQYESIIIKTYSKKSSPQRVHPFTMLLAEELSGQLALLETNKNPFYSPSTFVTQNGYDLWQKQERINISRLLSKFWHSSLPHPKDTRDLVSHLEGVHEHYTILLRKLMNYERRCRQDNDTAEGSFTPLSSTSNRLLLEFGLRFGIGEIYRKIIFLDCLTSEFSMSLGYISLVHDLICSIQHMLPGNKMAIVMVRKELDVLQASLRTLKVQTCKTLSQMKRLFPGNKPSEGVEMLMSLLRAVLNLMRYLAPAGVNVPLFESTLRMTIQSIFQSTYEMFKTVSRNDLAGAGRTGTDPRLLNILIQDIRDDVTDYKSNFEGTFQNYFSISRMAAKAYYQLLMDDVKLLTESGLQHQPLVEIDLRMLALAYRLNQLDFDWKQYIAPQKQTWRAFFLSSLIQLTSALRLHLQNLVLETVASDKYSSQNLNLPMPFYSYQSLNSSLEHPSRSMSSKSITPSVNSAFSSINSSVRKSPPQNIGGHFVSNSIVLMREPIPENESELLPTRRRHNSESKKARRVTLDLDSRSLNLNDAVASKDAIRQSAFRRFSLPDILDSVSSDGFADSIEVLKNAVQKGKKIKIKCLTKTDGCAFDTVNNNNNININNNSNNNNVQNCNDNSVDAQSNGVKLVNDGTSHQANLNEKKEESGLSQRRNHASSPFRILTPVSSDNTCPNHENSDKEESLSVNGAFAFPPLKLESHSATDFSHPVFTKPLSPNTTPTPHNKCRNFILHVDAPASMSSRASSTVDNWDPFSYNMEYDFSDSLESNVSFPIPPVTQAMLPISGSTVDLLVILQRLCSFSQTLVSTMITNSPFIVDNSSPSWPLMPSFQPTTGLMSSKNHNFDSSSNNGLSSRASSCMSQQPGRGDLPNSQHAHNSTDFGAFMTNDHHKADFPLFDGKKIKLSLHLRLLKAMCNMMIVYTSNMLCMDLCGTPRNIAMRLVGPQLLELTECQQKSGLIWGCRHQAEDSHDCLFYLNRETKYLCDRYEPVSQYMCTRINNTFASLQMLEDYCEKLSAAMKIDPTCKTPSVAMSEDIMNSGPQIVNQFVDSGSSEFVRVNHSGRLSENTTGSSSLNSSLGSIDAVILKDQHANFVYQTVEAAQHHSMAVLTAMCRLLAYKLNLFVRDGLPLLLHLKDSRVTMATALEPITSFLQKYLDSMSTWLYRSCFRRVLDSLWVLMVQDFETQAELLMKKGPTAYSEAYNWMLAISHLIKFMNNRGRGIKKDLLLSQVKDVTFRFQLFTLSTGHLITLYNNLKEYQFTEGDHLTLEENRLRSPPSIIHRIHKELQSLRKCFSGAELIHWIIKNKDALPADLALPPGPVVRDTAITISQILLDQQFIVDIDSETYMIYPDMFKQWLRYCRVKLVDVEHDNDSLQARNHSPVSFSGGNEGQSPYPQLSIHSQSHSEFGSKRHRLNLSESTQGQSSDTEQIGVADIMARTPQSSPESSIKVEVHQEAETNVDMEKSDSGESTPVVETASEKDSSTHAPKTKRKESFGDSHCLSSASEDFTRESFHHSFQSCTSKPRQDSFSSDIIFHDHSQRHTPFSSLASLFNNNIQRFVPSSKKFYLIHQSMLNPSLTNSAPGTRSHHVSESSKVSHRVRGSRESLALVEQCIVHKISPMNVLPIILARRKSDSTAKEFMKKVPRAARDKALDILDEPFSGCRSS